MSGYGQFCPVAKAMELLDERWTVLVVRELLAGSTHFNDLRRGVPKMSPTLLSKRLQTLTRAGVVQRSEVDGRTIYTLTECGRELVSVVEALGSWSVRWMSDLVEKDLDPSVLMWDVRRTMPIDEVATIAHRGGVPVVGCTSEGVVVVADGRRREARRYAISIPDTRWRQRFRPACIRSPRSGAATSPGSGHCWTGRSPSTPHPTCGAQCPPGSASRAWQRCHGRPEPPLLGCEALAAVQSQALPVEHGVLDDRDRQLRVLLRAAAASGTRRPW